MTKTLNYLAELRRHLLQSVAVWLIVFIICAIFSSDIYYWIALPLLQTLAGGVNMIAISVTSPFLVPFKSAFVVSLMLTMPFFFYQLWRFATPALYPREKQLARSLLWLGIILFYGGILFAYWLVLPLVFQFFVYVAPAGIDVRPDIAYYFSFVSKLLFAFGLAFEVPIVTILLVLTGVSSAAALSKKRPFVILGAFILGMILTPPDMVSQILLAIPLWLLYELGIFVAKLLVQPLECNDGRER